MYRPSTLPQQRWSVSQGVLVRLTKCFQTAQVIAIERLGRAEIHRYAMLHDPVLFQNLIQDGQRTAAIHHVVLRNDLEPAHHRFLLQDVLVVRDAETYTDTVFGKSIESIRWHLIWKNLAASAACRNALRHAEEPDYVVFFLLEPSVAQPPLPLQEFLPLQPASLVLQPPLPLQEFCPLQACFSLVACQMVPEDCPARRCWKKPLAGGAGGDGACV